MLARLFVKLMSIIMVLIFINSCVTSTMVTVRANEPNGKPVDDATVSVNGEIIGQTPNARIKVSNFVGSNPQLTVSKEGYDTVRSEVVKEVKSKNVVFGLLLNVFAWLWVYGPRPNQEIVITPEITG